MLAALKARASGRTSVGPTLGGQLGGSSVSHSLRRPRRIIHRTNSSTTASDAPPWHRAVRAIQARRGHVARRPDTAAARLMGWRDALWWSIVQALGEVASGRAARWRYPSQNWTRLPETVLARGRGRSVRLPLWTAHSGGRRRAIGSGFVPTGLARLRCPAAACARIPPRPREPTAEAVAVSCPVMAPVARRGIQKQNASHRRQRTPKALHMLPQQALAKGASLLCSPAIGTRISAYCGMVSSFRRCRFARGRCLSCHGLANRIVIFGGVVCAHLQEIGSSAGVVIAK